MKKSRVREEVSLHQLVANDALRLAETEVKKDTAAYMSDVVPETWILPKRIACWRGGEGAPCLSLRTTKSRQDYQH